MSFLENYQRIAGQIYDEHRTFSTRSDTDNPESWSIVRNNEPYVPVEIFNRIIDDLSRIGAITVHLKAEQPDSTEESGIVHDEDGNIQTTRQSLDVYYTILSIEVLRNKFIDLNETLAGDEEISIIEPPKITAEVSGFIAYDNGSVTYLGESLNLRRQLLLMFKFLLENHQATVSYEALADASGNSSLRPTTINKYFAELTRELVNILSYDPIETVKDTGKRLRLR